MDQYATDILALHSAQALVANVYRTEVAFIEAR
jgi:hypothetical protein